ncbi:MAG: hypothetical protein AB1483_02205 [Candidatus Zixiibacteriota bacterium]
MKIPKIVVPILVVISLFGGYALKAAFTQPTTSTMPTNSGGSKLECIVDGVKCKGTASFFVSLFENVAGINGIETYATDHRVIFSYDPSVITPDEIRTIMEAPVPLQDGRVIRIFTCLSMDEMP